MTLAEQIAWYIMAEGTQNTLNGSWFAYFSKIDKVFEITLSENTELIFAIEDAFNSKIVADYETDLDDKYFCVYYYACYCPNFVDEFGEFFEEDLGLPNDKETAKLLRLWKGEKIDEVCL